MKKVRFGMLALLLFWMVSAVSAQEKSEQALQLGKIVICTDVVDREPQGESTTFPAGTEKLYCYTRIEGASEETTIKHRWYHEGAQKAEVSLAVRSKSWRTWSSKTLDKSWTGAWKVEVVGENDVVLGDISFTIE